MKEGATALGRELRVLKVQAIAAVLYRLSPAGGGFGVVRSRGDFVSRHRDDASVFCLCPAFERDHGPDECFEVVGVRRLVPVPLWVAVGAYFNPPNA